MNMENADSSSRPTSKIRLSPERLWLILGVLILIGCIVRLSVFFGGVRGSDAFAYAQYAWDIVSGHYNLDAIRWFFGFRYTVLLPTALSYMIFGVGDFPSSLFPLLLSLLNILVVFKIGEILFNREIGLIAAVLVVFYPLNIMSASLLGPDSFIPFLSSAVLLCFLRGEQESSVWKRNFWFVMIGVLIGLAYMARVTSIFLFFALMIYLVFYKKVVSAVWTIVGLLLPLGTEALYFFAATGDPLFEFHRITSPDIVSTTKSDYHPGLLYYPKRMFGFLLDGLAMYGLTWWLVLGGIILAWKKRENAILLMAVCLFIPFFGFQFGFQSVREGVLIMKSGPYLSLLTAPAMIIGAYLLYHFKERLRSNPVKQMAALTGILTVIACMNLYGTYRLNLNGKNDAAPYIAVAEYLKEKPGSTVYTHHYRWPLFLGYFLKYDSSYKFSNFEPFDFPRADLSGAYVVLSRRYLEADVYGRPLPSGMRLKYGAPSPPNWMRVVSFSGTPPYNSVELYFVQP